MPENEPAGQTNRSPAPPTKSLKLRLVAGGNGEVDRYAIVPFPKTFEEAKAIAEKVFAPYIGMEPNRIHLRCAVEDKEKKWVWADMMPNDWHAMLEEFPEEVGVFPAHKAEPEYMFIQGELFISQGHFDGHQTKWTAVEFQSWSPSIDRPRSYNDAVMYIKDASKKMKFKFPKDEKLNDKNFTFYTFHSRRGDKPSTGLWRVLPSEVKTDDDLWRLMVPEPGQILGFMIEGMEHKDV